MNREKTKQGTTVDIHAKNARYRKEIMDKPVIIIDFNEDAEESIHVKAHVSESVELSFYSIMKAILETFMWTMKSGYDIPETSEVFITDGEYALQLRSVEN